MINIPRERVSPLTAILLLALTVRIVVLLLAGPGIPLTGDEIQYDQLARNLVGGLGFVQDTNPFFPGQRLYAWQAPLYPYTLAAIYALSDGSSFAAKVLQVLIGVATAYLVYRLAGRSFSERPAYLAATFVAVYPGLVTNTHLLLSETLFTFLVVLSLTLLTGGSEYRIEVLLIAGIAFGLAILTRGVILYFTPIISVWLAFDKIWRPRLVKSTVIAGVLFLVAVGLTLVPWALRNYATFSRLVLLETKGGVNFWLGNSPFTPNEFVRNVWKVGIREPILASLPQDEVARDRAGYVLGLDYVRQQPLVFLERMPAKFADFWGFERSLIDTAESTRTRPNEGWNSPSKILADGFSASAYVALIVAGIIGFVFAPDGKFKLLIAGFILYLTALHVIVFGDGRFHLPLIPFFALYAGYTLAHWQSIRVNFVSVRGLLSSGLVSVLLVVWIREIVVAFAILSA